MTADDADLVALRESVRKLLEASYPAGTRRRLLDDPLGYEPTVWQQMAGQLGLQGLAVPEMYGGSGAPPSFGQAVFVELGAALYSGPYFACAGLVVPALLWAGTEEARAEYLPLIADGSLVATLATTERGHDWGLDDIAMTAIRGPADQWRLTGRKAYVIDAVAASLIFVTARTDEGVALFAVQPAAVGCSIAATPSLDLTRRLAAVELTATPARKVSAAGDVTGQLASARALSMVALTGEQVGGATACLERAVRYARQREQFGRPVAQFQAIQHLCADMLVDLESASALAGQLARAADAGEDLGLPAAAAKALCSDVYFSVAARAIQVHGGIGFTWEHDAHLYYRRAKSAQLMFGDGAWQRRRVGALLGW